MTTPRKKTTRTRRAPRRAPVRKPAESQQLRNVWLAGLGAVAAASETAADFVEVLIAKGRQREPHARAVARRLVTAARTTASGLATEAEKRSRELVDATFDRLGVAGKPRQKNLLHRLGDLAEAIL